MSYNQTLEGAEFQGSKAVFLHHVDDFVTNKIHKTLFFKENFEIQSTQYEVIATIEHSENIVKVMDDTHPVEIINSTHPGFLQAVVNCDVIVFNGDSKNFEKVCCDARRVMAALEEWTNEQKKLPDTEETVHTTKYFILLSSPLTWALTTPIAGSTNEEEEDEIIDLIYEDDYRRRKAHRSYCKLKLLERDVVWLQKKCKHYVKSLVVCPGIAYGGENDKLHYIFKLAFYNKQVPIVRPGSQIIPLIYIKDLARIVHQLIDNFPESKIRYIFAVQPQMMQIKSFIYRICRSFNGDCSKVRFLREVEMLMMDKEIFPQNVLDALSLNIKLVPSYLKNFDFHPIDDQFWDELTQEFREARNLRPLKLVVDGPPLVGKTVHSLKLAQHYHLVYINIREIMYDYMKYLEEKINDSIIVLENFECPEQTIFHGDGEFEDELEDKRADIDLRGEEESTQFDKEDEQLIAELKKTVDICSKVLFKLKVYVASHKNFEKQEFEQVSWCLISLISLNQYNLNQGYIIDCFPFTYEQANQIYYNTRNIGITDITSKEVQDLGNVNLPTNPHFPLKPTHFIMFGANDKLLCQRGMAIPETEAIIRRCLRHQMLPRLDAYRDRNEEPNCLANIFYDNELIPITICVESDTVFMDTLRTIKIEIGSPFIYPLTAAQQKAFQVANAEKQKKYEEQQRLAKLQQAKALTLERERKLLDWTAKYEDIRRHEHELREVKTLPLRQYLGKYVLPTLTEGILKIAELKPDDPVDFLAEYLFKCNPEGQQMPPYCTNDQKNRFFETFYDDISSTSEYVIDKDMYGCGNCK